MPIYSLDVLPGPLYFFWQKAEREHEWCGVLLPFNPPTPSSEGEDEKFHLQVLDLKELHLGALGYTLRFTKKVYMVGVKLRSKKNVKISLTEKIKIQQKNRCIFQKGSKNTAFANKEEQWFKEI